MDSDLDEKKVCVARLRDVCVCGEGCANACEELLLRYYVVNSIIAEWYIAYWQLETKMTLAQFIERVLLFHAEMHLPGIERELARSSHGDKPSQYS